MKPIAGGASGGGFSPISGGCGRMKMMEGAKGGGLTFEGAKGGGRMPIAGGG